MKNRNTSREFNTEYSTREVIITYSSRLYCKFTIVTGLWSNFGSQWLFSFSLLFICFFFISLFYIFILYEKLIKRGHVSVIIWWTPWDEVIEACEKAYDYDYILQKTVEDVRRNNIKNL